MGFVMNFTAVWEARRARRALLEARSLLEARTPLKTNCGKLCAGACCQEGEGGDNGMLLFPYEDRLYGRAIPGFSFRLLPDDSLFQGGKRLVCEGTCPREHRPLACRLFPLRIRVETEKGEALEALAELDPRAGAVCPLPDMGGLRALDARFVAAVEQAGQWLVKSAPLREALENEQRLLDEMRRLS